MTTTATSKFRQRILTASYHGDITENGIAYEWGLAGPDGAWYVLLIPNDTSKEEINKAKRWLKDHHDVVTTRIEHE